MFPSTHRGRMGLIGALGLAVVVAGGGTYIYKDAHDGAEVPLPAKYQRGVDRFESLAACKKPLKNVGGSSDLAASVECDVATGRLRLVLSSDSNYLSSLQEHLCALTDEDQYRPVALPGSSTCYIRGGNYLLVSLAPSGSGGKMDSSDIPRLPKNL